MVIDVKELRNLRLERNQDGFCVTLIDNSGYEIIRGFGESIEEAVNDLHARLF